MKTRIPVTQPINLTYLIMSSAKTLFYQKKGLYVILFNQLIAC